MRPTTRLIILGVVATLVGAYLYRNPPADPTPATHTRYIKLDATGKPMGPWKGPWQCVYDTRTHLVWEVKKDNETVHDYYCSFSWYQNGIGVPKGGSCYSPRQTDTSDLIRLTNQEKRCGLTQWRLPTQEELLTLVQKPTRAGDPTIATDFFPFTHRAPYWTSTRSTNLKGIYAKAKKGAVSIHFGANAPEKVQVFPLKNTTFVRLVTSVRPEKLQTP